MVYIYRMDADISTLGIGDLVAVNCENHDREPAIGSCTEIFEDDIEIVWMGTMALCRRHGKYEIQKTEEKSLNGWTLFQNYRFSTLVLH